MLKINKKSIALLSLIIIVLPLLSSAQPGVVGVSIAKVARDVVCVVLAALWYIAVTVTVIMLTVAGFKFLTSQGNPQGIAEARNAVIWGIAGVIVIILAWSIITIVGATFSIPGTGAGSTRFC